MASLLRQIVAGPRARHDETGLDLCYVTDDIIAMSGPSQTYPQLAYRNPLDKLVAFLDKKHGENWAIWEFRAEGTGYPDEAVYGRIRHYPWPDHHPPPFKLVPMILDGMKDWLGESTAETTATAETTDTTTTDPTSAATDKDKRIVVVHCKAGKGRSGTMACAYLIAQRGWTVDDALARFTSRRMRPQFGSGVSIASQVRWVGYIGRWAKAGKPAYPGIPKSITPAEVALPASPATPAAAQPAETVDEDSEGDTEILEIHVWGLRTGVKVSVEGYIEDGRKIHVYHTFRSNERYVVEGDAPSGGGIAGLVSEVSGKPQPADYTTPSDPSSPTSPADASAPPRAYTLDGSLINGGNVDIQKYKQKEASPSSRSPSPPTSGEPGGRAVLFKPDTPIRVPGRDINIAIERRNKPGASYTSLKSFTKGLTMVTSVAHFWFNTYFEGNGPEQQGKPDANGVFAIDWDQLDGIKGSTTKGMRAAERIAVVWRSTKSLDSAPPDEGLHAADWKGNNKEDPDADKKLGLRREDPSSANVSRASSVQGVATDGTSRTNTLDVLAGTKTSGPEGGALDSSS